MKFVVREDQNGTSLLPVLSSQALFSWHHSMQDISTKWLPISLLTITLGYGCSEAILFWDKHALNSKNESSENREVDDRWEKSTVSNILLTMWVSYRFSPFANFESQPGCQNGSLQSHFFREKFFQDSSTLAAETLVSRKGECLLFIGKDKNISFLEWSCLKNTWGQQKNWDQINLISEGVPVDGDDPAHVQWICDKAKERAESFNIQGVTYRLTQGEEGNGTFQECQITREQFKK